MTGTPTIGKMVRFSWAESRAILFPFNFKRWFKILIMVWLAGAGIQGCSANYNAPQKPAKPSSGITAPKIPTVIAPQVSPVPPQASLQQEATSLPVRAETTSIKKGGRGAAEQPRSRKNSAWAVLAVGGMVLLGAAFLVFFMWLSSRFNFVLLDTLVTKQTELGAPFRKHQEIGDSYFKWSLAFLGIVLGTFLIVGLMGVGLFWIAKGHAALRISIGILAGIFSSGILLGMIFFGTVMRDFALPIMYREKIPAMSALNRFLEADTFAFGKAFQYFFVVFGLWILAIIVQGIVSIIVAISGAIAGGILAITGIFLIKALPFLKLPFIVLGSLVAGVLILAVIMVIGMAMLPVVIFFRVFALTYLPRLYPECDLLGFLGHRS